jgi:hypothetical protein
MQKHPICTCCLKGRLMQRGEGILTSAAFIGINQLEHNLFAIIPRHFIGKNKSDRAFVTRFPPNAARAMTRA